VIIKSLLNAFGPQIGGGYDISCKFGTTLDRSELESWAHELDYHALVGSFHGHAHNRLCQTNFLATYVEGMGLKDLEGCEHFFSKSNPLASSLHYASVFHRKQKIIEFMKHMDQFEMAQNISMFFTCALQGSHSLLSLSQVNFWSTTISKLWASCKARLPCGRQWRIRASRATRFSINSYMMSRPIFILWQGNQWRRHWKWTTMRVWWSCRKMSMLPSSFIRWHSTKETAE